MFGEVLGEILIGIVWILPFALAAGAVALIIVISVKRRKKKKLSEKTENTEQK